MRVFPKNFRIKKKILPLTILLRSRHSRATTERRVHYAIAGRKIKRYPRNSDAHACSSERLIYEAVEPRPIRPYTFDSNGAAHRGMIYRGIDTA